ncbi:TlpA family protein disulfide reductase [Naumannella halotolerans]|uniref:Thiol-disulfide isomerase/thioredoxin n=1 Tax=Naumannella halotolerans TaxID=993414 RepID=A0A4R7IZ62_9ACTN|nr:TlpA disulfide reductase family protein [Naumannella halotolerans]TDT29994.1 thiol-disulfide isomerase/thioredoxin [Naumannella halotolerans]
MRARLRGGVVATLVALLVLTGCSSGRTTDGFVSPEPGLTQVPPQERQPAPVLTGTTLTGEPISFADYPGKVLVVNVWGSWCAPCRKEAPELVRASEETADVAQFIGINTRDQAPAAAIAFERENGVSYPSIFDVDGQAIVSFADTLPPNGIPSTLIIDTEGRVAARILGPTTATTLVGLVEDTAEGK